MLLALRRILGRNADVALVAVTIGILIVLFTPIPAGLLDVLLLANLGFALLLLLLTFYMEKPSEFSTFPSLLLIATLMRLALNIASTRLILAEAYAGEVIGAVGNYVVGGNYVIGLIVFLILVVVQFVVVTNGAQRVAEVAARFTLDSMPGQQMSIDADLNMGLIDQVEAQRRRRQIEKEANFYGAMDGASKFVKGDAIAGILILLINIIGGFLIGVLQRGMDWQDALQTYTLLMIGDGIVTQVPAVIIALGTGIIVTRSSSDARLGDEVWKQISLFPKPLAMVALAMLLFAFLPGIPVVPTVVLAAVAAAAAIGAHLLRKTLAAEEPRPEPAGDAEAETLYQALTVEPVAVAVGQNLIPLLEGTAGSTTERIGAFRKRFASEVGFVVPKVRIVDDKRLNPNAYRIALYGNDLGAGELLPGKLLAIHGGGSARARIPGVETRDPTYGLPALWIDEEQRAAARGAGYTVVEAETVFVTHLTELLRRSAAQLLTRAETERLVNRLRPQANGLLDELMPSVLSLSEVQHVLQNLLTEKVSIRNLEAVLEVMLEYGRSSKDPDHLTELVRRRLGASICQALVTSSGELHVLTLDAAVEHTLSNSVKGTNGAATLALEPRFAEQLLGQMATQVERMMKNNTNPVLLCAPELRRHLRRFTERVLPHLSVVSMAEVPNTVNLRSFAVVAL